MDGSSTVSSMDSSQIDEEQGHRTPSLPTEQPAVSPANDSSLLVEGQMEPSSSQGNSHQALDHSQTGNDDDEENNNVNDVSRVMQSFLADFLEMRTGASTSGPGDSQKQQPTGTTRTFTTTTTTRAPNSVDPQESTFESGFDLTDERLRYVFGVFDEDGDGRLDYDSLRRGLQFQFSSSGDKASPLILDDDSFNQLTSYLDVDKSGDVSFEEFSEGVRLMILRGLLRRTDISKEHFMTEIFDYDENRLQRHIVNEDHFDVKLSSTIMPMSPKDFYFQDRETWVRVRWVNIHDVSSRVLERVGVKYKLHPLAIKDALDPENHRPKAEAYSTHYYLKVPNFHLEPLDINVNKKPTGSAWNFLCDRLSRWCRHDKGPEEEEVPAGPRMGKIAIHTASVFVCLPGDNTVITYIKQHDGPTKLDFNTLEGRPWKRVQKQLTKSYSKLRQYSGQYLCYSILDEAVGMIGPILKKVTKEIQREKDFLKATRYKDLTCIHKMESQLRRMSRNLKPFVRLLLHVIEDDQISPGPTVFLRDVLDNLENYDEEVKNLIRECANVDSEAEKCQQQQVDSTLYVLTVISAVFLPAQFLTGVWGMNFQYMPELDDKYGYLVFWILSLTLMVCTLLFLNCGRIRA